MRFHDSDRGKNAIKGNSFSITCLFTGHLYDIVKWTMTNESNGKTENHTLFDFEGYRQACSSDEEKNICTEKYPRFMLSRDLDAENSSQQQEKTSVLIIKDVQDYDRGIYRCFVKNMYGTNNATIFVRVKGKYLHMYESQGSKLAHDFLVTFIMLSHDCIWHIKPDIVFKALVASYDRNWWETLCKRDQTHDCPTYALHYHRAKLYTFAYTLGHSFWRFSWTDR